MFSILSPSEPILRAKIENMISPDYVLCYIPWPLETLDKKWKICNVERGGGGPFDVSGGPFAVLEILEKKFWIWEFFSKILKNWKFSKFRIKIFKVGSKFWRWEGYIILNFHFVFRNTSLTIRAYIRHQPYVSSLFEINSSEDLYFLRESGTPPNLTQTPFSKFRWDNYCRTSTFFLTIH